MSELGIACKFDTLRSLRSHTLLILATSSKFKIKVVNQKINKLKIL